MHNATTKQRLSALRRKLGIFTGGWAREPRRRLRELREALTPAAGFPRPAAACAGGPAPSTFLATSLTPSGSPPPPDSTSTRWVSDSMIVPATKEMPRPKPPPAAAADPGRMAETFEAPDEARRSRTRWIVAIAAAGAALAAVLFLVLRAPEPSRPPPAPGASAPAAAPAPAPAESAMMPPLQAAPPLAAAPAAQAAAAAPVLVRRGDTLWALSGTHLGDPLRWPRLHRANRDKIRDPDLIYPGQRLDLPPR